jgi:TM2 domain-containing membrane protein YozV
MKNPGLAAVLCFFYTGLGQIYNGEIAKGVILFVLRIFSDLAMLVLIGFITTPVIWIYGMYDAYSSAVRFNRRHGFE